MLKMKISCELCRSDLRPDDEAKICSYECTYCAACADDLITCPNCAGELVRRPRRTTGVTDIARRAPGRVLRRIGLCHVS